LRPIVGVGLDRYGRKPFFVLGVLIYAASMFMFAGIDEVWGVNGSIARISTELRNLNPGIRQLAILHKDQKAAPGIGNIDIDEWLLLPFTIIELYAAVEQVLTDTAQPETTSLQSSGQRTPENTNVDKQSKDLSSLDNSDVAIRWRLTNTSVETLLEEQMVESGAQAALLSVKVNCGRMLVNSCRRLRKNLLIKSLVIGMIGVHSGL